jgi:hypothetical protein
MNYMADEKVAIFVLTRGYNGKNKYHYLKLVFRNLYIKRANFRQNISYDLVVFHEGNISFFDQILIKVFSTDFNIKFVYVKDFFRIPENIRKPYSEIKSLGYEMMCIFNYFRIWNYLKEYDIAIRIDDDCLVRNIPTLREDQVFSCAAISEETHEDTKRTLPVFLQELGDSKFYDDKFPYTNVYITRLKFWLQSDVQKYLLNFFTHNESLINRWGDLPIIGITLKKYGAWNYKSDVLNNYAYIHLSHSSIVKDGKIYLIQNTRFKIFKNTVYKLIKWS